MNRRLLVPGALALLLAATSCSTGPAPPQPGTPAFYWGAAKETWRTGDILKTNDNLQEIVQSQNEFTERARTWEIIVSAGIAQGLTDLSEGYEAGARANRANPIPFRKQMDALRALASTSNLELAEAVHQYLSQPKTADVALEFEYPVGSAQQPPATKKIYQGMILQDSEAASYQSAMVQRGVLLALCDFLGAPDDPAKVLETFKAGGVKAPREVFLLAAARALQKGSALYGETKLDNPQRLRMLDEQALVILQNIPETKESKTLSDKIQGALKKLKT